MKTVREQWAFVAVALLAVVVAWPLWTVSTAVYGLPAGDLAQTGWFYDFVIRRLMAGGSLDWLSDFNYPNPLRRIDEFPNILDAVIAAPVSLLFSYPQQYGASQALAVLINGLGFAWLARSMGCRGLGVWVAGGLGVCCQQVWRELYMARLNAAFPGLAGAALASWLQVLEPERSRWERVGLALCATLLGAAAALVYPPLLLLLAPAGAWMALSRIRGASRLGVLLALIAVVLACGLVGAELEEIRRSPRATDGRYGQEAICALGMACSSIDPRVRLDAGFMTISDVFALVGVQLDRWVRSGLLTVVWLPGLLAPILLKNRAVWLGVLGWAVGLTLLSMGPCPEWKAGESLSWNLGFVGTSSWCAMGVLHDFGRLLSVATLLFAVATGRVCESLCEKTRFSGVLPWIVGCLVLIGPVWTVRAQLSRASSWLAVPVLATTDFLNEAADGPVVELPFDRRVQFLSALQAPERKRVNTLNTKPRGYSSAYQIRPGDERFPFVGWLVGLGRGAELGERPTLKEAQQSGVRWVVWDGERCGAVGLQLRGDESRPPNRLSGWADAPATACRPEILEELRSVLGEPQVLPGSALAWGIE
ncbi:MAG: hypothetical protein VX519_03295 [Myxococcota bacterium]|nr:hypothetical protein [Myxococcota bacterium]